MSKPKVYKTLDVLPHGATVIDVSGDYVLSYAGNNNLPWITYQVNSLGHEYNGEYFKHLSEAYQSLLQRSWE